MNDSSPPEIVIEGHRDPKEAVLGAKSVAYLPFEVPAGVTSIEIIPEILDREGDRNTVDLGLFDPNGPDERGFRGWQGGTRLPATLTGSFETSSPWLIAGPIPAGVWHLAQSYLAASTTGLDYRYTIRFQSDGITPPSAIPTVPDLPGTSSHPGRYVGAIHVHSDGSDGAFSLPELVERHHRAGFDFLAVTDHNSPAAHWRIASSIPDDRAFTILPGLELTTPSGHATFVGTTPGRWIDHRIDPGDGGLRARCERARCEGALIVVAHPFATCLSCGWHFPEEEWATADGIEVWNGVWDETDEVALAWWEGMLREGKRLWAYGGSDFHREGNALWPAVVVTADSRSRDDLRRALRVGEFTIVRDPVGIELDVELKQAPAKIFFVRHSAIEGGWLSLHTEAGTIARRPASGEAAEFDVPAGTRYARFELRDEGGAMLALTNPIWFEPIAGASDLRA